MKKLITCASLAAVGTMTVDAQPLGEPSTSKTWSVAAKLRGFYDSNYNTGTDKIVPGVPNRPEKAESWGIDVRPSVGFNMVQDTTAVNLKVAYGLRWYEDRTDNEIDQSVLADLFLGHDLNETARLEVKDQFVYSSEPDVMQPGGTPYRTEGSNIRNYAGVNFLKDFSETWGMGLGYSGTVYDYEQEGNGSRSALLDRWEHNFNVDARRHFQPTTTGLIGYEFGMTDMTSSDRLSTPGFAGVAAPPMADFRNYYSHYGYVGVDHALTAKLAAEARVGVQYADYYNAKDDMVGPYAEAALSYWYREDSRVMVGLLTGIYPTDVAMAPGGGVTLGTQATMVYAAVSHAITSRLTGYVRGSWQGSEYQGMGGYDGEFDNFVSADVNLTYDLTKNVALEAGYQFDDLSSDIPQRGYDRHRGYAGVKATY